MTTFGKETPSPADVPAGARPQPQATAQLQAKQGVGLAPPLRLGRRHRMVVAATLTVTATISTLAWIHERAEISQYDRARFGELLSPAGESVQQRLRAQALVLQALCGFIEGGKDVGPVELDAYVAALNLSRDYPGIRGVGYCRLSETSGAQVGEPILAVMDSRYEQAVQDAASRLTEFEAVRGRAVEAQSPVPTGQEEFGFDSPITGFLWLMPLQERGAARPANPGAEVEPSAWAFALVESRIMAAVSLGPSLPGVNIHLYRGETPSAGALLVHTEGFRPTEEQAAGDLLASHRIEVAGQVMVLTFHGARNSSTTFTSWRLLGTAVIGICVSLLMTALVWFYLHSRAQGMLLAGQADREMRQSEALSLGIAHSCPALHWMSDAHQRITFFNQAWLTFRGRSLEQERDHGWIDGLHPEDAGPFLKAYDEAFKGQTPFSVEFRLRRLDGEYRWVLNRGVPRYALDGTFAGFYGACLDIGDRKNLESELRTAHMLSDAAIQRLTAQSDLMESVLAHIPHYVFWKDCNSVYLGCNRKFAEAAGLHDPGIIVGRTDYDMPWSREEADFYRACDRQVISSGQPLLNIEETQRSPTGSTLTILTSKVPLRDASGRVLGILGIFEDITERKRAEMALHTRLAALDAAADMIVITDLNGEIKYVNPAFEATTGYTADEVVGQTPRLLKSDEQDADFYRQMWRHILSGKTWQGEITNRRKDGRLYPEEMTITPIRGEDGLVARFVAIKRDITARREREAIEHDRQHLRQAVTAMERVLGVISHELRTPLAGVRAMSEYLLCAESHHTREHDEFLKSINHEIVRMANMVNDILEVARINSGAAQWNWSEFTLLACCQSAVDLIRPLVRDDRVRLELSVEPRDLTMRGDEAAIRRLVLNLLSNAQRHTDDGFIRVVVEATSEDGRAWIELRVEDTGTGMSPEIASKLGEAFALNSGIVGDRYVKGSGLGLAICRGIVGAHDGSILVRSTQGNGTAVVVRLRGDLDQPAEKAQPISIAGSIMP